MTYTPTSTDIPATSTCHSLPDTRVRVTLLECCLCSKLVHPVLSLQLIGGFYVCGCCCLLVDKALTLIHAARQLLSLTLQIYECAFAAINLALKICQLSRYLAHVAMTSCNFSFHPSSQYETINGVESVAVTSNLSALPPSPKANQVCCALANVRSMCNKAPLIAEFIVSNKISLLYITETWLTNDTEFDTAVLNEACPPNFSYISLPRKCNKRGGGLALIFNKQLSAKIVPSHMVFVTFEMILITISVSNTSFLSALIYRPPSSSTNEFINEFDTLCSYLTHHEEILLLGDFNIPNVQLNDEFQQVLVSHGLQLLVSSSTHSAGNILDLIITRISSSLVSNVIIDDGLSDHNSVLCSLSPAGPAIQNSSVSMRKLRAINQDEFNADLYMMVTAPIQQRLSSNQITQPPISEIVSTFDTCLSVVLDKHAPLVKRRPPPHPPVPWWSNDIVLSRQRMRLAEKLWRRSKLLSHRDLFTEAKREHHVTIRQSQRQFIIDKLSESTPSSKNTWRLLHNLLGRHQASPKPDCASLSQLSTDFNLFFLSKPRELRRVLAQTFPEAFLTPPVLPNVVSDYLTLSSFSAATVSEVRDTILNSPIKSSAADALPTTLLRKHLPTLLPVITLLMNKILSEGMPQCWKNSLVVPLIKKSGLDHNCMNNYRPVSQLPFLSKIAERLVSRRLIIFLEQHKIMDNHQFAYRANHSCESALTYVFDYVYDAMNAGKVTVLTLLDLSAAFDSVDHSYMLEVLSNIGIKDAVLDWFSNYLIGRQQSTIIDATTSASLPVQFGVPQGSVLGPVLFSLYILGLYDVISAHQIDYIVYADDIQLFVSATYHELPQTILRLEACIADLHKWLTSRRLTLNSLKTEVILLGQPRALSKCTFPGIHISGTLIPPSTSVRSLGIKLDPTMSLISHASGIRSAAFARLRLIARVRKNLRRCDSALVVKSLVLSHLNYCCSLLTGINSKSMDRLQQVINAAVRLIHGLNKFDSARNASISEGLLPIRDLIKVRALLFIFSVLKHGQPILLANLTKPYTPPRHLRSDDMLLLHVPRTRSKIADRGYRVFAPRIWNSLPLNFRTISSRSEFANVCYDLFVS